MCLGFLLTSDEHFGRTDDTSFTLMHLPSNSGGRKIRSMAITNGNNTETLDRFFMFENECIKYSDFFIHPFRTDCWSQLGVSHGSDNLIVATARG